MANVVVSEVLYFLLNKFMKITKVQLRTVLLSFYAEDELNDAKEMLFAGAAKVLDDLPRFVKRSKGDNRARLIADDLLDLCSFLDEKGCVGALSHYAAYNLVEDMETFCMAQKLAALEKRLDAVESMNIDGLTAKMDRLSEQLDGHRSAQPAETPVSDAAAEAGALNVPLDEPSPPQDLHHVTEPTARESEWTEVVRKPPTKPKPTQVPKPAIRLFGAKNPVDSSGTVRAVPRKSVLAAFVGRLHIDTTEEELTSFLTAEGMKGVVCRKLKSKDGRVFKVAAYYVTCSLDSKDLFYSEHCWPDGVELRDWVYKQ